MKPTKNRVHCLGAGKVKMLFETEKQAENFIKFNTKDMEEQGKKVPVRTYYCNMCGGWHVTSNPDVACFDGGTYMERVIGCCIEAKKRLEQMKGRKRSKAENVEKVESAEKPKKAPVADNTPKKPLIEIYEKVYGSTIASLQKGPIWHNKGMIKQLCELEQALDNVEIRHRTVLMVIDCINACIDWTSENCDAAVQKPATRYLDKLNDMCDILSQYDGYVKEKADINERMEALKVKYADREQFLEVRRNTERCRTQAEYLLLDIQEGRTACAWTILESISLQLATCASEQRLRNEVKEVLTMLLTIQQSLQNMKILR